jgi:hypothetical protein
MSVHFFELINEELRIPSHHKILVVRKLHAQTYFQRRLQKCPPCCLCAETSPVLSKLSNVDTSARSILPRRKSGGWNTQKFVSRWHLHGSVQPWWIFTPLPPQPTTIILLERFQCLFLLSFVVMVGWERGGDT